MLKRIIKLLKVQPSLKASDIARDLGVSRKSMIYKLLNSSPEDSLNATSAAHMLALEQGAHILRVHDVKPAMEVIALYKAYKGII